MTTPRDSVDVCIVGAGAAGLMCGIEAGRRGRSVAVLEHARAPGEKIRISGGGRCNFTNLGVGPHAFLSRNPRFALSALRRYTQHDFIDRVNRADIAWHEKTLGQLFCDGSSRRIVQMLTDDLGEAGGALRLGVAVETLEDDGEGFRLTTSDGGRIACASLVVATGGKSIPKMGATGWAYEVARRFGVPVVETRPALVPLTFETGLLERLKPLAGVSTEVVARAGTGRFREAMLFTHRGLSGPAILQISSYWREGEVIVLDMAPDTNVFAALKAERGVNGRQGVATALARLVPRRLADMVVEEAGVGGSLADTPDKALRGVDAAINGWTVKPVGSEGYRTAEVTLGGIDTAALDQKTMAVRARPGLYFIGEAVDVTGWLGGYNFQWAWSSGWAAGQAC